MNKIIKRIKAKLIQAEWVNVNINTHDITIILTDAMIQNSIVKINYKDSGWRNILPYGWYITKDNNVILYCYKEDFSIRSYRLDRIYNLYVDDKLETDELQEVTIDDFTVELPENSAEIMEISENEQGAETPFDESLEILENDFVPQEENIVDNNVDNTQDFTSMMTEVNPFDEEGEQEDEQTL